MFEFHFFSSQLVPFLTQGRKGWTQKRDVRDIFGEVFWLIPAAAVPRGSQLKPRGRRQVAGGHSHGCSAEATQPDGCRDSATAISQCHMCFHLIPCSPHSPCPHPITRRTSALKCVLGTGSKCGWSQTLPCLVLLPVGKSHRQLCQWPSASAHGDAHP